MTGVLLGIFISPHAGVLPVSVERVRAIAGRGLDGDRYATLSGTFSANKGQRDVTLIEAEVLEDFAREYGCQLSAAQSRRNLLTRGVRLNELVGCDFVVGGIPMRGLRLCEPCTHLARLTSAPVLPGLVHRGGIYAEILEEGDLVVGDSIMTSRLDNVADANADRPV